jgi:hypothetical protein
MDSVVPFVRHMLLCDDVQASSTSPHKINVYGLLSAVRSADPKSAYPVRHSFAVYMALTGRGSGEGRISVIDAGTGDVTFRGQAHTIDFGPDPLKVLGVIFRIQPCLFPRPGLYWVEFQYNNISVARQPLLAR